jgi:hypothetical protein
MALSATWRPLSLTGVVDLAETAPPRRPLDGVSLKRPISIFVLVRVHGFFAG